jgi:hypothetical protein
MASFRIRGKIFAAVPDDQHLRVMSDKEEIHAAVSVDPAVFHGFYWGTRLACLVVDLAGTSPQQVRALLIQAWLRKAPAVLARQSVPELSQQSICYGDGLRRDREPGVPQQSALRGGPAHVQSRVRVCSWAVFIRVRSAGRQWSLPIESFGALWRCCARRFSSARPGGLPDDRGAWLACHTGASALVPSFLPKPTAE